VDVERHGKELTMSRVHGTPRRFFNGTAMWRPSSTVLLTTMPWSRMAPVLALAERRRGWQLLVVGGIEHVMKKKSKQKSKLFLATIAFALLFGTIAVLQVFHLHPELSIGNVCVYWTGQDWTLSGSGTVPLRFPNGQTGIQKDYDMGPVGVSIIKLHPK
jgi:hypothetical protein